jgi:hypothetical protein
VSILLVSDVVLNELHHFEKFKNIVLCKTRIVLIIEMYLIEWKGCINQDIGINMLESIFDNICC